MADNTAIQWTDSTWNPTGGCSIVSPGCTNCYAMKTAHGLERRFASKKYAGLTKVVNGNPVWTGEVRLDEDALLQPLKWKRPRRIFVNSMSDLFHETLPDEAIDRVFAVMALCPQHTFQVLTKRAERMREYVSARAHAAKRLKIIGAMNMMGAGATKPIGYRMWPLPNVWLGISCERQQEADERIPLLLQTPAAVRFISAEPLLGAIDLHDWLTRDWHPTMPPETTPRLDWVIVGGESGTKARPMHPDWARSIRDQCNAAGVAYFFKQFGEYGTASYHVGTGHPVFRQFATFTQWVNKASTWVNGGICLDKDGNELRNGAAFMKARDEDRFPVTIMHRVGKKAAGRLLDGREWNEFPEFRR